MLHKENIVNISCHELDLYEKRWVGYVLRLYIIKCIALVTDRWLWNMLCYIHWEWIAPQGVTCEHVYGTRIIAYPIDIPRWYPFIDICCLLRERKTETFHAMLCVVVVRSWQICYPWYLHMSHFVNASIVHGEKFQMNVQKLPEVIMLMQDMQCAV